MVVAKSVKPKKVKKRHDCIAGICIQMPKLTGVCVCVCAHLGMCVRGRQIGAAQVQHTQHSPSFANDPASAAQLSA